MAKKRENTLSSSLSILQGGWRCEILCHSATAGNWVQIRAFRGFTWPPMFILFLASFIGPISWQTLTWGWTHAFQQTTFTRKGLLKLPQITFREFFKSTRACALASGPAILLSPVFGMGISSFSLFLRIALCFLGNCVTSSSQRFCQLYLFLSLRIHLKPTLATLNRRLLSADEGIS
jgi:hypothetical protein